MIGAARALWAVLTGSKVGQYLALLGFAAAALLTAFALGDWRRGVKDEAARQKRRADTLNEITTMQQEAHNASDADLADRLTRRP